MIRTILLRTALLAAVWWAFTGGGAKAWGIGAPVIALALATGMYLQEHAASRLSLAGLPGFLLFFLSRSMKGGVQVAWMAVRPRMGLRPDLLDISLRLPGEAERLFLAGVLNLLPGTLSVGLEGRHLRLHVLDRRQPIEDEVRRAEAHVARLFGVEPE